MVYVVGRHFGLDVSGSPFYLAAWAGEDTDALLERDGRIYENDGRSKRFQGTS